MFRVALIANVEARPLAWPVVRYDIAFVHREPLTSTDQDGATQDAFALARPKVDYQNSTLCWCHAATFRIASTFARSTAMSAP